MLLPGITPAPLGAQQGRSEIAESQQRLEQIRRERARLRTELTQIRSSVHDISSELRNLEGQVSTSADLLHEMEFQISETQYQIERTSRELTEMQQRLAHRKQVLNLRLSDIYKRGPLHTPQVLLAAESFGDLLSRYKYLYLLARRDRALVHEVSDIRNQLITRDRALQRNMAQLETLREERAQEHGDLANLEQQRKRALSGFQTRERTVQQQEQKLAQDERRLTSLIAELERKRREAEREAAARREAERRRAAAAGRPAPAAPSGPTITAAARGSLPWPVDGRILYRFGRVVQPNGTAVRMNGIGIAGAGGAAVRSVEAGTVMLAGPFEGYGPTVVISHGGGYYSLYLYLRTISVKEGAEITRGQTVGTIGGSDRAEGAHIEFQIRAPGGEAVDPLVWLRARGG
ncbi:MAG: peptidoglycan DD-metalloendopeptidase family protein [Gemmatimonadetes bacterium]|nr:peptidoglycan DD-metalloendopeptidase family protein [Gemmatimonadota bacterium]